MVRPFFSEHVLVLTRDAFPYTALLSVHYTESQCAGSEQRDCRAKQERVKAREVT